MRTALVTGANRGLGKGFTEVLLEKGYLVFAGMRDTSSFKSGNKNLIPIQLDVLSDDQIKKVFDQISNQTETLDLIVNSAGLNKDTATKGNMNLVGDIKELDRDLLLKMFDVNAVSPIMLVKYLLPLMKNDPSFIINISSNRASFGIGGKSVNANYGYRASKVALNMMTKALTEELPKNVKTFTVHPGSVRTDMNPNGKLLPTESAESIIKITNNWNDSLNGVFLSHEGKEYPL